MFKNLECFKQLIASIWDKEANIIEKTPAFDSWLCQPSAPLNLMLILKNNVSALIADFKENKLALSSLELPDFGRRNPHDGIKTSQFSFYQIEEGNKFLLIESAQCKENIKASNVSELDLVATATHDLKNPLSAIFGFVDTLLYNLQQEKHCNLEETIKVLQSIAGTSRRALNLVRNYEQLFLILNKKLIPKLQSCNLLEEIKKELGDHQNAINRIEFKASDNDLKINMHPNHFERVLANLIQNALKFSEPDGKVTIELGTNENKPYLKVSNTGSYISPEDRDKIFEKYQQAENPLSEKLKDEIKVGTGLGLYIVSNILKAYKYSIKLESQLSKNMKDSTTSFTVIF